MTEMVTLLDNALNDKQSFESKYYFNGISVPRVTAIISRCNHSDGLMYWANSLGFKHKSYSKTLEEAANIGTICHNGIDSFMEDNNYEMTDKSNMAGYYAFNSFRKWFDEISLYAKIEIIFHEHELVCPYFGGTLDGLYKINDKVYLIDYKTSNHITYNYCLQLAAYRYMLRTVLGINIDGAIILQFSKTSISYNEYVLNFNNPMHLDFINRCEQTFLSLVYAYYNLVYIETAYKKLDWEVT